MKLRKGFYNSLFGLVMLLVQGVISLIKISVVISILGDSINGLNNLFSQVFRFILIGEAGLGLATTTSLYKPISENNNDRINKIVSGSRVTLTKILLILFFVSVIVSLVIPLFINHSGIPWLYITLSFLLFAIKALIPQYLQAFKGYVSANQDEYKLKIISIVTTIVIQAGELVVLILSKNYIYMLIYGIISTSICELIIYFVLKKSYPKINFFFHDKDFSAKKHLTQLVRVNVVSTVASSVDPLIISSFMSLTATSLYSNYSYIQNYLMNVIGIILSSFTHYFGDLFAINDENTYHKFSLFILLTNLISTIVSVSFFFIMSFFVFLWINEANILPLSTTLLFSTLIYMYSMMRPINILVTTNQFFNLASKSAFWETSLNLAISIVLIRYLGLNGVLLGSLLSYIFVSFWYFPVNTYKNVFGVSAKIYFIKQISCIFIFVIELLFIFSTLNEVSFVITWHGIIILTLLILVVFILLNVFVYFVVFKEFRCFIGNIINKRK